jgi:demethoxyubiquinone hydroxylase (CLK1/Coq7/Cat5 family)
MDTASSRSNAGTKVFRHVAAAIGPESTACVGELSGNLALQERARLTPFQTTFPSRHSRPSVLNASWPLAQQYVTERVY